MLNILTYLLHLTDFCLKISLRLPTHEGHTKTYDTDKGILVEEDENIPSIPHFTLPLPWLRASAARPGQPCASDETQRDNDDRPRSSSEVIFAT